MIGFNFIGVFELLIGDEFFDGTLPEMIGEEILTDFSRLFAKVIKGDEFLTLMLAKEGKQRFEAGVKGNHLP